MERFLFQFGFETPPQAVLNREHLWDDEDSAAIFIDAENEAAAEAWGRVLMEGFLDWMFSRLAEDWHQSAYGACALDRRGSDDFAACEKIGTPVVAVGSFPDWSRVSAHRQPARFDPSV